MTTYNTGNPLGSQDPRDLYDNAQNTDAAVNGDSKTWTDRLGRTRVSMKGVEEAVPDAIAARDIATSARDAAISARDAAMAAAGPIYATVSDGIAAVADGALFRVLGTEDAATYLYRRDSALAATLLVAFPSKESLDRAFIAIQIILTGLSVSSNDQLASLRAVSDLSLGLSDASKAIYEDKQAIAGLSAAVAVLSTSLSGEAMAVADYIRRNYVSWYTGQPKSSYTPLIKSRPTLLTAPPRVYRAEDSPAKYRGVRLLLMAPCVSVIGNRIWVAYSSDVDEAAEAKTNFTIVTYSDDGGGAWYEAFHLVQADTNVYRTNTPIMRVEPSGELTILTGADGVFSNTFSIAFSIKNPLAKHDCLCVTSPWVCNPSGYPNDFVNTDGRTLLVNGLSGLDGVDIDNRGINFFSYDFSRRWLTREAKYIPPVISDWPETSVVQLRNGAHCMVYRTDTGMRIVRSPAGIEAFDAATDVPISSIVGNVTVSRMALDISPSGNIFLVYNKSATRTNMHLALMNENCTAIVAEVQLFANESSYPQMCFHEGKIYITYDYRRTLVGGISPTIIMDIVDETAFLAEGAATSLIKKTVANNQPNIKE